MKNPLYKRLPRELRFDIGKYIALFLFLTATIGFISGFLVADGSMVRAYDDSFDKYKIENGHFILGTEANGDIFDSMKDMEDVDLSVLGESYMSSSDMLSMGFGLLIGDADGDILERIEDEEDVTIQEQFYKDKTVTSGSHKSDDVRIYRNRHSMNLIECMEGAFPEQDDEIMIDRLYAENNHISIGDELEVDGTRFTVCGFSAFSDYSALYKDNNQLMFDANHFTVAVVTDAEWNALSASGIKYCYAWRNKDQSLTEEEQRDKAEDIMDILASEGTLQDIVARPDNNAIVFTGDDMSGDKVMIEWLLYILMVVIAFIYGVSTRSTIESETKTIGTLRASGYTRKELLYHYLALPMIVTLAAAVVGNILGYTAFKFLIIRAYYHSYSLPTYHTIWNGEAFLKTTIIPLIIIFVVNLLVIGRALRYQPLQFLRGELGGRKRNRNAMRLPNWSFPARFRARIIIQNHGVYLTLLLGIFLASVLLLFGLMLSPLITHLRSEILDSQFAKYQYVLKAPVYVDDEDAEKYAYTMLENEYDEEIAIYGIQENSKYFRETLIDEEDTGDGIPVRASSAYMDKYQLEEGAEITLHDEYEDKEYHFVFEEPVDYPSTLCIFMPIDRYNEVFGNSSNYYTGYLSDHELTDIDDIFIASVITTKDLTLTADQMQSSMGRIFIFIGVFATVLYILILYLLARIAIDRNAHSISLIKILGYTDSEAGALYNRATAIVSIVSLIISTFLSQIAIREIYYAMMREYSGWMTYYISPWCYVEILAIGLGCYMVVSRILMRRIRKIPMAEALKGNE